MVVDNKNKTNTEEYDHGQCTMKRYSISLRSEGEQKRGNNETYKL